MMWVERPKKPTNESLGLIGGMSMWGGGGGGGGESSRGEHVALMWWWEWRLWRWCHPVVNVVQVNST